MNTEDRERKNAFYELEEMQCELDNISARAKRIVQEHFPGSVSWVRAYDVLNFGRSVNPYDSTFEKLIENLHREDEDEGYHRG